MTKSKKTVKARLWQALVAAIDSQSCGKKCNCAVGLHNQAVMLRDAGHFRTYLAGQASLSDALVIIDRSIVAEMAHGHDRDPLFAFFFGIPRPGAGHGEKGHDGHVHGKKREGAPVGH